MNLDVTIRLGGPDEVSIALIEGWPHGLFYRPGLGLANDAQIKEHFANGSAVFIDGDVFERYFVQRVRNYGHLETLSKAQIRHAIVRGSCHEGHFVNIADAMSWLKHFRKLSAVEYERQIYGRDFGFPPFSLGCDCRMEGLIEGTEDFHQLNGERKRWRWFKKFPRR